MDLSPPVAPQSAADSSTHTASPAADDDITISPASDLMQLHDMENQTRLESVHSTTDQSAETGTDPTSGKTSSQAQQGLEPSTSAAVPASATASHGQHFGFVHPPFPGDSKSHLFHSSLGTGSALEALLADAPKTTSRLSPAAQGHSAVPPGVSGYYRPVIGGQLRGVLLALETQGPGQVAVYRPATGPAAKPMRLSELQGK